MARLKKHVTAKDGNQVVEIFQKDKKKLDVKKERIREFRAEATRKASMANKRIARLEKAGLTDSPAYQKYIKDGGGKFGVRGKTYNQVQAEVARLDRFLNTQSSTIRGVNNQLRTIAENTGIKYKNMKELKQKSSKFFELSSKVEQYLRQVDDMASAIGYQKIWEAINTYTKAADIDLANTNVDIDFMIENITGALKDYEEEVSLFDGIQWYSLKDDDIKK